MVLSRFCIVGSCQTRIRGYAVTAKSELSITSLAGDMVLLAKIAQAGSISQASRLTGFERTTVSRRIARLERYLGTTLLNRSNREVTLTEAGQIYCQYCFQIIEAAEEGVAKLSGERAPSPNAALIELAVPDAARFVASICRNTRRSPQGHAFEYEIKEPARIGLGKHCDVSLRLEAQSAGENTVAIPLRPVPRSFWIGTEYSDVKASDRLIGDLTDLQCIFVNRFDQGPLWQLSKGDVIRNFSFGTRVQVATLEQCRDICVDGNGVSALPDYMCQHLERQGKLERLLPDWSVPPMRLYAVHRKDRFLNRAAREFIDPLRIEI